jgi:hypothetical protein
MPAGVQVTEETPIEAVRFTVVLAVLPLYVAVRFALELLATEDVVALNVAEDAVAATVTDPGTVRTLLLLEIVTPAPPAGAGLVRVTVHVLEPLAPRLAGVQARDETATGAMRFSVAAPEVPLYEAVRVAV